MSMSEKEIQDLIIEKLGFFGNLVSGSKSGYVEKNPDNLVVFNSNLILEKGAPRKVWYGDVDITKKRKELQEIAKAVESTLYILREMDGRFDREANPNLERFVYKVDEKGNEEVSEYYKGKLC